MSKPLPPRSPLVLIRHRKRANGSGYCTRCATIVLRLQCNKPFIICRLHCVVIERVAPNRSKRFNLELYSSHLGNRLQNAESGFDAQAQPLLIPKASSRTTVTKITAIRRYRFFLRTARECSPCAGPTHHSVHQKSYFGDCCYLEARSWRCPGACLRTHRGG